LGGSEGDIAMKTFKQLLLAALLVASCSSPAFATQLASLNAIPMTPPSNHEVCATYGSGGNRGQGTARLLLAL
jgi:hypothetical protein